MIAAAEAASDSTQAIFRWTARSPANCVSTMKTAAKLAYRMVVVAAAA